MVCSTYRWCMSQFIAVQVTMKISRHRVNDISVLLNANAELFGFTINNNLKGCLRSQFKQTQRLEKVSKRNWFIRASPSKGPAQSSWQKAAACEAAIWEGGVGWCGCERGGSVLMCFSLNLLWIPDKIFRMYKRSVTTKRLCLKSRNESWQIGLRTHRTLWLTTAGRRLPSSMTTASQTENFIKW